MQRGGLTATNRKTAMTALGIKPKSKEFDPSRFGDKASIGTAGKKRYKTGGMVNSNTKVSALKVAGTKGTKSGVNSKVSASKVAKGRSGGTSTAPKKANP